MKKTRLTTKLLWVLTIALSLQSCKKDDNESKGNFLADGFFIINEGQFNADNGSISFYDEEQNSVTNDIFYSANNRGIGDVVQSATIIGDKLFIAVNNSNKIEVAQAGTLKEIGVITNIEKPRYIADAGNGKAYVSTWNSEVIEINTQNLTISDRIPVGNGAEGILVKDGKLLVACSGGYLLDSTVYVFNTSDNTLISKITAGYSPTHFETDKNNNTWVLCSGKDLYDSQTYQYIGSYGGSMVQLSTDMNSVALKKDFSFTTYPSKIGKSTDGSALYIGAGYGHKGIQKIDISTGDIAGDIIKKNVYGFGINPNNGDIIACIAPAFDASGHITKYSANGDSLTSFTVGIGPNAILFK